MSDRWLLAALSLAVFALFPVLFPSACLAGGAPRVYVVHSYNPEYVWTGQIGQGLAEALAPAKPVIKTFYMDAKRRPSPQWLREAARRALGEIEAFDPDLVVAADDVAQEYLVVPFLKGKARPQVIFCGVNAPVSLYGYPASNVSGVRERWHFREGFALLKRLIPDAKSIVFMMDDSESSHYIINDLNEELASGGPFALELAGIEAVRNFKRWQEVVLRHKDSTDALAIGLYQTILDDSSGAVLNPADVVAWTVGVMPKPSLGFTDVSIEHGVLCGILEAGHEQGYLAGEMALEILSIGVKAGELPMRINQRGVIMVNLKTAERLKVDIPYEIIEAAAVVVK